jgi:hypothetical protein
MHLILSLGTDVEKYAGSKGTQDLGSNPKAFCPPPSRVIRRATGAANHASSFLRELIQASGLLDEVGLKERLACLCRTGGGAFDELPPRRDCATAPFSPGYSMQLQDHNAENNRERLPSRIEGSFCPSRICRPYERNIIVIRGKAACSKQDVGDLG